jgi:hypothetical protein
MYMSTPLSPVSLPFQDLVIRAGDPLPEANRWYMILPSIHSSSFFEELMKVVNFLLEGIPGGSFNLLIEAVYEGGRHLLLLTPLLLERELLFKN